MMRRPPTYFLHTRLKGPTVIYLSRLACLPFALQSAFISPPPSHSLALSLPPSSILFPSLLLWHQTPTDPRLAFPCSHLRHHGMPHARQQQQRRQFMASVAGATPSHILLPSVSHILEHSRAFWPYFRYVSVRILFLQPWIVCKSELNSAVCSLLLEVQMSLWWKLVPQAYKISFPSLPFPSSLGAFWSVLNVFFFHRWIVCRPLSPGLQD